MTTKQAVRDLNPQRSDNHAERRTDATARSKADASAPRRGAALRRIEPKAQMPLASILKRLEDEDVAALEKTLSEPMECVFHKSFARAKPDRYLHVLEEIDTSLAPTLGGDPNQPAASSTTTLSAAEERELFLALNYCRYRALRLVRDAGDQRLSADQTRRLLSWLKRARKIRTHILQANLSLVPAMAKRSRSVNPADIGDLICEGNLALLRSVDKFDCTRGFKFSTYACRAIISSFSSSSAKTARYRNTFPTEFDPALERSDDLERRREEVEDDCVSGLRHVLSSNSAGLSMVEQRVLEARFDLLRPRDDDGPVKAMTLKQVAELIGVTKERVRQIQNKALDKLRVKIEEDILAA